MSDNSKERYLVINTMSYDDCEIHNVVKMLINATHEQMKQEFNDYAKRYDLPIDASYFISWGITNRYFTPVKWEDFHICIWQGEIT